MTAILLPFLMPRARRAFATRLAFSLNWSKVTFSSSKSRKISPLCFRAFSARTFPSVQSFRSKPINTSGQFASSGNIFQNPPSQAIFKWRIAAIGVLLPNHWSEFVCEYLIPLFIFMEPFYHKLNIQPDSQLFKVTCGKESLDPNPFRQLHVTYGVWHVPAVINGRPLHYNGIAIDFSVRTQLNLFEVLRLTVSAKTIVSRRKENLPAFQAAASYKPRASLPVYRVGPQVFSQGDLFFGSIRGFTS